ncbi:MAG: class I SAM-dependent methyltransferase [Planctomycetaceae bacterium]|nr:class I SAM-dependent methyltransferase [Planctomycetaceae bacterium]
MPDVIRDDLYNFPKYYDLLFGSDWKAEFDFMRLCFEKHTERKVKRVFEPACGTGRLLIKLAQAGYDVAGNDLNPKAVDYCNTRLARHGFARSVTVGDMSDFKVRRKYDAGFNMINSFRHLPTEQQAESHLRCMADAINKGGLYLLGLHLIPTNGDRSEEESWSARRGNLVINSHMWSKAIDLRRRMESLGMRLDVYTPTSHIRIDDEMFYRTYNKRQMNDLISRVPEWEVAETYDFSYDIHDPIKITSSTEDVVYILRRR